jgi:hypothetical protein
MYTLAASATQPIFEGGTLLGQLDLQKGTREQLLQTYRPGTGLLWPRAARTAPAPGDPPA